MRGKIFVLTAILLAVTGAAFADTLAVNNTAAMGGSGTACGGSNCGLEVTHDNSSVAYVEDLTPDNESIYRFNFLFNPASTTTSAQVRQTIFNVITANPNPNNGDCSGGAFVSAMRGFYYRTGPGGINGSVLVYINGNLCGQRSVGLRIPLTDNDPVRICAEMETGNSNSGMGRVTVVDDAASCPPSGDPAYQERAVSNGLIAVDRIRIGTPQTNNFGAGETMTLYFDEFESFRTLAGE
jgi:hypothetical protein